MSHSTTEHSTEQSRVEDSHAELASESTDTLPNDSMEATDPTAADDAGDSKGNRWKVRALVAVALIGVIVLIGAGWRYYMYAQGHEWTDDAFIEGDIVRIGARVPGTIQYVLVSSNDHVEANQLLVKLDPSPYEAKVAAAKASLAVARRSAPRRRFRRSSHARRPTPPHRKRAGS